MTNAMDDYRYLVYTDKPNQIYNESGGSGGSVEPATEAPKKDGTVAVGTSLKYAREDHVHPTDTSRAPGMHASTSTIYGTGTDGNYGHVKLSNATNSTFSVNSGTAATPKAVNDALTAANSYTDTKVGSINVGVTGVKGNSETGSFRTGNVVLTAANIGAASSTHTHGSITNAGSISAETAVASGDKLIISDSSDSSKLKKSGIAFGSSTTTFLANNGTWQTPSGGGGGGGSTSDDVTVDVVSNQGKLQGAWGSDLWDAFIGYLTGSLEWDEESPITLTDFLAAMGAAVTAVISAI